MEKIYDYLQTRFGWIGLVASAKGLTRVTFPMISQEDCMRDILSNESNIPSYGPNYFEPLKNKLSLYFKGYGVSFDEEQLDCSESTVFQKAAWLACMSIPLGQTRTYKWLSTKAGSPKAARAAGQAMAQNRWPIIVPCHRVIASDGRLKGYGKGTELIHVKKKLLDLEFGFRAGGN